jgi:hypothetical protein
MIIYKQVLLQQQQQQQQQSSQSILRATDTATQFFYNFGNRKDDLPPTEPSDILLLLYP